MNIYDYAEPFKRFLRAKRMRQFVDLFGITSETRILDVGGTSFNWLLIPVRPRVTIVNLYDSRNEVEDNITYILGDGRYLPFKANAFDIAYSNSVIEHLGDYASQQAFSKEIARVGNRYCIQTPNRWFPIEQHLITPLIHFLPKYWQKILLRNFSVWGLINLKPKHSGSTHSLS